eukprot:scaffold917_cov46-Cylindrotheca_fusiformis.AAC.1
MGLPLFKPDATTFSGWTFWRCKNFFQSRGLDSCIVSLIRNAKSKTGLPLFGRIITSFNSRGSANPSPRTLDSLP